MKIVVFTGAGPSAESGLGTFRDTGGIWEQFALTVKVGTEDGTWLIEKSYAAGAEIDLELPQYSGEGPAANGPAPVDKVGPGSK